MGHGEDATGDDGPDRDHHADDEEGKDTPEDVTGELIGVPLSTGRGDRADLEQDQVGGHEISFRHACSTTVRTCSAAASNGDGSGEVSTPRSRSRGSSATWISGTEEIELSAGPAGR